MTALSTDYMGLALRNPLVASASPLSKTVDGVRQLADAGVGAVVLYSLFEEQLRREAALNAGLADAGADSVAESLSYFPSAAAVEPGPSRYLSLLARAVAAVDIPVIASLNGVTPGGWSGYARALQDAGAAAIELNIYYLPGVPQISARDVEQRHVDVLARVKDAVTVPVAVKLSPYFSSMGEIALRLDDAGADGLVLFNRFLQPDIDPDKLTVVPAVDLSQPAEARVARTWIALLRGRVRAGLAASTGVETAADVAKYLLAGADVVMTTSALVRHGPQHATTMLDDLTAWMAEKGFTAVDELRGMLAAPTDTDGSEYERAGYVRALQAANAGAYDTWWSGQRADGLGKWASSHPRIEYDPVIFASHSGEPVGPGPNDLAEMRDTCQVVTSANAQERSQ
jgi:dihydroorotate dehydrogenase (fumarate)